MNFANWRQHINTPQLAKLCAYLTGDGHIQLKEWRGLVSFYSKDKDQINSINNLVLRMFRIKGHIYLDTRRTVRYKLFFISKPLAQFLVSTGTPFGNKANQPYSVPDWIVTGSPKLKSAYLRGLFTAEGSVCCSTSKCGKERWQIGIEQYKWVRYKQEGKKYMSQIKSMLGYFGIISSPVRFGKRNLRKDGTNSIAIKLDIEAPSFGNFYKYIGFDLEEKNTRLLRGMRRQRAISPLCGGS